MQRRVRVCIAVLAAGASRRMGSCKMAMRLPDGSTLLGRAFEAALACGSMSYSDGCVRVGGSTLPGAMPGATVGAPACEKADDPSGRAACLSVAAEPVIEVVAVTGAHRAEVVPIMERLGVCELHNPDWAQGQATSVALAARHALEAGFDALLVTVADQPFVGADHLHELVARFTAQGVGVWRESAGGPHGDAGGRRTDDADGRAAISGDAGEDRPAPDAPLVWRVMQAGTGRRGNPCLFARPCLGALTRLSGDEGARALFRAHPELPVQDVAFDDPLLFEDADTPQDLARIAELLASRGREGIAVG